MCIATNYKYFREVVSNIQLQNDLTIPAMTKELRAFCDKHDFYLEGDKSEFYCSYDRWYSTQPHILRKLEQLIFRGLT